MNFDTALLVIDVQVGMFPKDDPVYAGDVLLERIGGLIAKARSKAVPIVYVQHNEGEGEPLQTNTPAWNIHPAIAPGNTDIIIQKHTPDSFHETNLQNELTAKGIKKLVLTGIQTDLCVNATARRASELGYDVTVAKDAHSTWSQRNVGAQQIIDRHNDQFREFASVIESENIKFSQ
ncbi:cysteine hydrolase family protein [Paenibacillus alkalitolerans]|uniref:cysteine hydrolase family protein n=1 Tax=Paenibacillus alkalitolerans TaxID=2799335 RepID=UPI0018F60EE7|nr:cysteine hydrolase family protein [Paenibacillus alkalitolerans]